MRFLIGLLLIDLLFVLIVADVVLYNLGWNINKN